MIKSENYALRKLARMTMRNEDPRLTRHELLSLLARAKRLDGSYDLKTAAYYGWDLKCSKAIAVINSL